MFVVIFCFLLCLLSAGFGNFVCPLVRRGQNRIVRKKDLFHVRPNNNIIILNILLSIFHANARPTLWPCTDQCLFVIDLSTDDRPSSRVHRSDRRVFAVICFQSVRQIVNDVPEHDRVYVVAEHIQQHPVAELWPAHDVSDSLPFDQPKPYAEQIHAHPWGHNYDEPKHRNYKWENII